MLRNFEKRPEYLGGDSCMLFLWVKAANVTLLEINSNVFQWYMSIQKKDIMIINWQDSTNMLLNYIQRERTEIKGKVDKSSTLMGDFIIYTLTETHRTWKKNVQGIEDKIKR